MAVNRFKNNLDKEKAKEIVGNNIVTDEIVIENKVEESKENTTPTKKSKKITPSKKLKDNIEEKPKFSKLGVPIKENIKIKVDALAEDNNMKANEVVVDLLKRIFDGKNFNIEIEEKDKTKVTSYNIPIEMEKAIIKINKKTGATKSEIFNKLLEESLKDFFE